MRWANQLLLAVLLGICPPALAASCPTPDAFVIPAGEMAATKEAIGRRALTILFLGGSATLGGPAQGAEFTYPYRLAARLRDAFPGLAVTIVVRAIPRQTEAEVEAKLEATLAAEKPSLVIWGPGATAAGRGDDLDTFIGDVTDTVDKIKASGADLILMTLQYAPSVARVINLASYRKAVLRAGEMADVPVMDRYEFMRFWSDDNFLDLDATDAHDRVQVARKLFDCIAEILTDGLVDGVH